MFLFILYIYFYIIDFNNLGGFMLIFSVLIDLVVHFYKEYLTNTGMSLEDVDKLFYLDSGKVLSNQEFFETKKDFILCNEVLDKIYEFLCNEDLGDIIDLDNVICLLISNYILSNYSINNEDLDELNKMELVQIKMRFCTDNKFGIILLRDYFNNYSMDNKKDDNRLLIYRNGDDKILRKWEQGCKVKNFDINSKLRNVIYTLYNHYVSMGCGDYSIAMVYRFFTDDVDPLCQFEELGINENERTYYKNLLLRLILADVYEDVVNGSILISGDESQMVAEMVPVIVANTGVLNLPNDDYIMNYILFHFVMLQDDFERRLENRRKTYLDNKISILKKVNPNYKLDELTF